MFNEKIYLAIGRDEGTFIVKGSNRQLKFKQWSTLLEWVTQNQIKFSTLEL